MRRSGMFSDRRGSRHPRPLPARLAVTPLFLWPSMAAPQVPIPEIVVTAPSPIIGVGSTSIPGDDGLRGALPVVTDQFATITVISNDDIRRNGAGTLGDLLFSRAGITGSGFAPGASSRPIIRGLDSNRVHIQENGVGANGASDLGEDHFVPVDPLSADRIDVIRGPATLRYASQAVGGVVETGNNRIPDAIPSRGVAAEIRGNMSSIDSGINGALLLDAGGGNVAIHADVSGRAAQDYRVPHYPYLIPPDPAGAPRARQPQNFNGRQPNSALRSDGQSIGGSYIFNDGFIGVAVMQNNARYHIPGINGDNSNTRIDAWQTKVLAKGEWRAPNATIDALRFWAGATNYKHNELGLSDPLNASSDGVRQAFANKEQEGRVEAQFAPFDLRLAQLTTTVGLHAGHQQLTAPSPDNAGLWDPNSNRRIAGYLFNEFRFSDVTRAQLAGRIERVDLTGTARGFDDSGLVSTTPVSPGYTPKSVSIGLIQQLPWNLSVSLTGQHIERAPKPAELFSGGGHDATATFDKGNSNLAIETAQSIELGLRRATGPFRFELTAYYTRFKGFIFRRLTGNTCDGDTAVCGPAAGDLNEAAYSQADAVFRGGEFQSQFDLVPLGRGMVGIENQFDIVRATFVDGGNVPRIPPLRLGGGVYWRDPNWLARVFLLHAFAQNNIALAGETATPGYNDLRAEVSYTWKVSNSRGGDLREFSAGITGANLLNAGIRNHASYNKDQVLLPGAGARFFVNVKY